MKDKDKPVAEEAVAASEFGEIKPEEAEDETGKAPGGGDEEWAAGEELSCEEQLVAAERKVEGFRDQMLRTSAELENTRKRNGKEIERIRKYALESFAVELLVVKDNLERGLDDKGNTNTVESMREGVNLTLELLEQAFTKFGIEEVSVVGQAFDPELHQAMSTVETDECEPNTVTEVAQKGYLLNGRLIRPAMVMVSKPKTPGNEGR